MKWRKFAVSAIIAGIIVLLAAACGGETTSSELSPTVRYALYDHADVIDVAISGVPGDYSATATISSDDRGCGSYVDWWEVISEEGELLTRRVLLHAHVDEQPFTRSMGGLKVQRLAERAKLRPAEARSSYVQAIEWRGAIYSIYASIAKSEQVEGNLAIPTPPSKLRCRCRWQWLRIREGPLMKITLPG